MTATATCKLADIKVDIFKGIENTGYAVTLEHRNILKLCIVKKYSLVCEHFIDAVHPFLHLTSAALQDESFLAVHTA